MFPGLWISSTILEEVKKKKKQTIMQLELQKEDIIKYYHKKQMFKFHF